MPKRRPGRLTDEDREIWEKVAKSTTPLLPQPKSPGPARPAPPKSPPRTMPKPPEMPRPAAPARPRPAPATAIDRAADIAERLQNAPVHMDRSKYDKLTRGKLRPEARIDLHGMTLSQAQPVLTRFISDAAAAGKRLVLVITGKGATDEVPWPMPQARGVLRQQVPHWLHAPPIGHLVMQVTPAHRRHGGTGAYYVYLKRRR